MPAPFALAEPVDLVLHIGSGKTGTTSAQLMLERNRDQLAERGLLYPSTPGSRRHVKLGLAVRSAENLEKQVSWHRQKETSPERFRRRVLQGLTSEIEQAGLTRVLLSDEALYGIPNDAVQRLREYVDTIARRTRVVVYLRRQDDHLCSRYQQVVKTGETRRLVDRLEQMDLRSTYDYHAKLQMWRRVVDPDELVVRRFERTAFKHGSLYEDYLDAVGVSGGLEGLRQPERPRNESLDAESVEFLRLLNMYRVEHDGARERVIDNAVLVKSLVAAASGPTLSLPPRELDAFMAGYQESNEAVAREFLGDPSGRLFHEDRKASGTTTEQLLDPARLEHFLTVCAVPEQAHRALADIVEREAARWRARVAEQSKLRHA